MKRLSPRMLLVGLLLIVVAVVIVMALTNGETPQPRSIQENDVAATPTIPVVTVVATSTTIPAGNYVAPQYTEDRNDPHNWTCTNAADKNTHYPYGAAFARPNGGQIVCCANRGDYFYTFANGAIEKRVPGFLKFQGDTTHHWPWDGITYNFEICEK